MQVGPWSIDVLTEGTMLVDAGMVFGGLPRSAWETRLPPDASHRVQLNVRQFLLRRSGINLLVDAGFGNKIDDRVAGLYGLKKLKTWKERLEPFGLKPEDITHVILSHLHLEHAGGVTHYAGDGNEIVPTFTRARHYIQETEWKEACVPNDCLRESYRFEDFLPLQHEGLIQLISGDQEIVPGLRIQHTGGHTRGHQMVIAGNRDDAVFLTGDLVPTRHHLYPAWLAPGDQMPLDVLEAKKNLLRRLLQMPNHSILMAHDCGNTPVRVAGSLERLQINPEGSASIIGGNELPLVI